jgi:hypothetical protein
MSNMLEQAIVDAKALKETALKDAEATILEKYSSEIEDAVSKLLEQDDDLGLGLEDEGEEGLDLGAEMGDDPAAANLQPGDETVVADIPTSFGPESSPEQVIELNLDDIIALEKDAPSDPVEREELADSIGIPELEGEATTGMGDIPANREDAEVDINEDELVEMFKEMLTVDIPTEDIEEAKHKEEIEEEENNNDFPLAQKDGVDAADRKIEELKNAVQDLTEKLTNEQSKNKEIKEVLLRAKNKLEEVNLSNARLYYTNCVMRDSSLNERQKHVFSETISKIQTVNEAKVVYETLLRTVAAKTSKSSPKSLSEAVAKTSSTIIGSRRREQAFESDPTKARWAKLAGL